MSSISQSSISVSSIAKCYRVCCSETPPGHTTRTLKAVTPSRNACPPVMQITDSADRNKAAARRMPAGRAVAHVR